MKKILSVLALAVAVTGCSDADVASRNLSTAADNFHLDRRIVFYNTWKGEYLLSIEGRCSIEPSSAPIPRVAITCKTSPTAFKKHYLALSGHVTYFSEQMEAAAVSTYRYKVIFKPEAILPDVAIKTSAGTID